ncbi:hypothetical protein [Mameliella alba]|uniref:Uncharacterized protein n=1 Tax=Mameliella alba TaxID=561184 RepID=A0A0B3RWK8_9RHOB|nr:hypothetical protein [Mameliella alba]KHQ51133.1 hypothetical protein OA50_04504 [Mameliella alba]
MIRQPTRLSVAYAWWRQALADPRTPRHDADPQCGYYARRAVKNGPLLPVRVYLDQEIDPETGELADDEVIRGEELGRSIDPARIWTHLKPITVARYDALVAEHRTNARMAATNISYDVTETPMRPR